MTNQQLARNLRDAERRQDVFDIAYYENEIIVRLNLDPDETEQGLTKGAADAIEKFLQENGTE